VNDIDAHLRDGAPAEPAREAASPREMEKLKGDRGLRAALDAEGLDAKDIVGRLRYEADLAKLQIELVKLQRSVQIEGRRVAILFEGRDASGKGGAIRRFIEHLNPRAARVVALPKPSEVERGQWYFQRYVAALPNAGEICFFDRSWYNRAVVEPVMGFCSKRQYQLFMQQVPEFEHMLYEDGIELIKFWFSISKDEQARRFDERRENPLKQWKLSPVDDRAQEHWDLYTRYKEEMFSRTHTTFSPWIIVRANSKKRARLESMRYVLSQLRYEGNDKPCISIHPDPAVVRRFHRSARQIDT
jgi:polyphosphate kinase 2